MRAVVVVVLGACSFRPGILPASGDAALEIEDALADTATDTPTDVVVSTCLETSWCRRKPITVDTGKVTGGPHIDFTLLVHLAGSRPNTETSPPQPRLSPSVPPSSSD